MKLPGVKTPVDTIMMLIILTLASLGLVTLLSASYIVAEYRYGNPYYFFKPQLVHVAFGMFALLLLQRIPYQIWAKYSNLILTIGIILLIIVLIPGVGRSAGGALRWIRIFGFSFQPSELVKLAIVFYMARSLTQKGELVSTFSYGLLPHLLILAITVPLVLIEPDFGNSVIISMIAFIMMIVGGVRLRYIFSLVLLALPILYFLIFSRAYRYERWVAFMDPWSDPQNLGYHIIHSFYAFASGGFLGVGPGGSQQKLFFLPEAHTDFIFPVLGEELGFIGVFIVASLFLALVVRGYLIARSAKDMCGVYMALGCTTIVGLQAFLNMAVVMGLLPTKGLPLPFFSYGGTNIVVTFAALGIVLNVAGQSKLESFRSLK